MVFNATFNTGADPGGGGATFLSSPPPLTWNPGSAPEVGGFLQALRLSYKNIARGPFH
jgi:hypothetical protein